MSNNTKCLCVILAENKNKEVTVYGPFNNSVEAEEAAERDDTINQGLDWWIQSLCSLDSAE